MNRIILIVAFIGIIIPKEPVYAQKFLFGAYAGSNINFITEYSQYDVDDDIDNKVAFGAYNIGAYIKTNYKHFNFLGTLEYAKIKNKYTVTFTDETGFPLLDYDMPVINHSIMFSTIGTIDIVGGLYGGAGISCNFLIKSTQKMNSFTDPNSSNEYHYLNNTSFKTITCSVPVMLGYDFGRVGIFTRFNIGIINRLKSGTYVKEYDNTLMLGLKCRLSKLKQI